MSRSGLPAAQRQAQAAFDSALVKNGFDRDASGRLLRDYEIGAEPDRDVWGGAAISILDPLIAVFGARAGSNIEILAPLAPERDIAAMRQMMP